MPSAKCYVNVPPRHLIHISNYIVYSYIAGEKKLDAIYYTNVMYEYDTHDSLMYEYDSTIAQELQLVQFCVYCVLPRTI